MNRLLKNDWSLFAANVNERTLTHRLALYLECEFPGWDVDCEYNRCQHDAKTLRLPVANDLPADDDDARTVFPDIIVHRRQTNENLLVIEAKKTTSIHRGIGDRVKLGAYIDQLNYEHGLFVVFGTSEPFGICAVEFIDTDA